MTSSILRKTMPVFARIGSPERERGRILGEGVWVALGQVGEAIGLLVGVRVLTEIVSPDVFGTASLLIGIMTIASNVVSAPQLQALVRFYPDLASTGELHRLRSVVTRSVCGVSAAALPALAIAAV